MAALTVPSFPSSARPAETTCQLETALGQLLSDATYSLCCFDLWWVCERHEMNHATLFMASM
jgi:hypothetical protein